MAEKRALIAAVLCTVGASEFFTQDLEDMDFDEPKQTRKVKNITPQSSSSNGNSQSAEHWYEKGKKDAELGKEMTHPKVKPYTEGYFQGKKGNNLAETEDIPF